MRGDPLENPDFDAPTQGVDARHRAEETELTRGVAYGDATHPDGGGAQPAAGHVGRFVILGDIGAGGMGVVHLAYDPQLNRRVALKLMRVRAQSRKAKELAAARLMREAQALAQVSHRNVVAVYDVGQTADGDVYIAMEYVEGRTLDQYCDGKSWRDVIAIYRQAAAGLAACHGKGLVHRDFKPSNVLVDVDGRAVVLDFGLARSESDTASNEQLTEDSGEQSISSSDLLHTPLTICGQVVGTPAYMSPEQALGRPVDSRSDQFSFCVALYRSLYGQRPYRFATRADLVESLPIGQIEPPPRTSGVPGWVWRVVERGLARRPEVRWPSLMALAGALGADPTRRRRRLGAAGVVAVLVCAGVIARAHDHRQVAAACAAEGAAIAELWTADRNEGIAARFTAANADIGTDIWRRTDKQVTAYVASWRQAREQACRATELEQRRSPELLDRSRACFDDGRNYLELLIEQWQSVDAATLRYAVDASFSLPPVSICTDDKVLALQKSDGSIDERRRGQPVRRLVTEAQALIAAGQLTRGAAVAEEAVTRAAVLEIPSLVTEAQYAAGVALELTGNYTKAVEHLREAYFSAYIHGDDLMATAAAADLTFALADRLERAAESGDWERLAEAGLDRLGWEYPHPSVASALGDLGNTAWARGDYARALELQSRSLRIIQDLFGPYHRRVVVTLGNIGIAYERQRDFARAVDSHRRTLAAAMSTLGDTHIVTGMVSSNLAVALERAGLIDEAIAANRQALSITRSVLGDHHLFTAQILTNLATTLFARGELDEARALAVDGLAAIEATPDPSHQLRADIHGLLGWIELERGDHEAAYEHRREGLAITLARDESRPATVGNALVELAHSQELDGQLDEALAGYERGVRVLQGDDNTQPAADSITNGLLGMARIHRQRGVLSAAEAAAQRAVDAARTDEQSHEPLGEALFMHAQVMADKGPPHRERAAALAREALAALRRTKAPRAKATHDQVEAWLATH